MLSARLARFRRADAAGIVMMTALLVCATAMLAGAFSAVFLRAYPFRDSDRLVMLWESDWQTGVHRLPVTEQAFPIYQDRVASFEALAYFFPPRPILPATLAGTSDAIAIAGASPDLFSVIGVAPLHGRTFTEEEGMMGAEPVAVISHRFWRQTFGADVSILGQPLDVHWLDEKQTFRVVGVMPPTFAFPHPLYPDEPDLWVAFQQVGGTRFYSGHNFYTIGRIKKDVELEELQAEVTAVSRQIGQEHPREYSSISATAVPLRAESLREVGGVALVFGAAFLMVSGIGVTNLLHLIMMRTRSRTHELSTRLAMGASRAALVRLLGLDLATLAVAGAAGGALLAVWGSAGMLALLPRALHVPSTAESFAGIVFITTVATVLGVVALGVLIAWRRLSGDWASMDLLQRATGPVGSSKPMKRAGDVALLWQTGTACALATLTIGLVQQADTIVTEGQNLRPETLLSMDVRFDNDVDAAVAADLEDLVSTSAETALDHVALIDSYPYSSVLSEVTLDIGSSTPAVRAATVHVTTRSLMQVFGLSLSEGRWFDATDGPNGAPVAVVNESFARHYLAGGRVLGRRLGTARGSASAGMEIVGVIRDPARFGTQAGLPSVYLPWEQVRMRNVTLVARTHGDARRAAAPLRDRVLAIAPGRVQVRQIRTGEDVLAEEAAPVRLVSEQLWWVSAVALLLAYGGISSITLFRTASRTKEFALRRAIGSTKRGLVFLILKEVSVLLLLGTMIGWVAALALAPGFTSVDTQLSIPRALPFVEAGAVLFLIGLIAALPPLVRAMSVDPAEALRP